MTINTVTDLFKDLMDDAIDLGLNNRFIYYSNMTTAHAERMIIALLKEKTLYKFNEKILVKYFGKICFITLNDVGSVKVKLPFSPKHICDGWFKNKDLRTLCEKHELMQVVRSLTH